MANVMQPIPWDFDLTNVDPYVGQQVYPAGLYPMQIDNMEVRLNNDNSSGHNLWLEYTFLGGEFQNRKFYENLNLWHTTSEPAKEVAIKQLSSIGHAVGVIVGNDLTQLARRPMLVELSYREGTAESVNPNTGEKTPARQARNNVIRRDPYNQQVAAQSQPHVPMQGGIPSQPNAAAASNAPPMMRPPGSQPAQPVATNAQRPNGAMGAPPMMNQAAQTQPPQNQGPVAAQTTLPPWQQGGGR